jgi:hypothetical protein
MELALKQARHDSADSTQYNAAKLHYLLTFRCGGYTYVCSLKMLNMYGGYSMMLVTFNMQTLRHREVPGYFTEAFLMVMQCCV